MRNTHLVRDLSDDWQAAYQEQRDAIETVRRELSGNKNEGVSVEQALETLRDLLEEQFAREEQSGGMQSVTERAPRLQPRVKQLLTERQVMLDQAEKLRLLIHSGVDLASWRMSFEESLDKFADLLASHHQAEIDLLEAAFAQDPEPDS